MDPQQVIRDEHGIMRCRECGFAYALSPQEIVERAGSGLLAVQEVVANVPKERRPVRPQPGVWSVNAYTAHLADASEVILSRIVAIAETDRPPLAYHDQDRAVEESQADKIPADESLTRLSRTVGAFQQTLRALPAEAWTRVGLHARAGEVELREIAHDMPHELEHHAEDIVRVGREAKS